MKIIFLGAPGSGKGTHAQRLSQQYGIPQISTGDIFRQNLKEETPLGLQIKDILASGGLVPDSVTVEIVKDRLLKSDCAKGYILDGFPRSIAQAEALDRFQNIDYVVTLDVDKELLINRLCGRKTCTSCNGVYHIATLGGSVVCPNCGGQLITRSDDSEETVKNRIKVYEQNTFPLIEYYTRQGKVKLINANNPIDKVYADILDSIVEK
ncbi:MAG: adenylate kinase [Clostridia bacterium]